MAFLILSSFHYFCLGAIHICALNARDNPNNDGCASVPPSTNVDPGFMASNSVDVDIADDEEPERSLFGFGN